MKNHSQGTTSKSSASSMGLHGQPLCLGMPFGEIITLCKQINNKRIRSFMVGAYNEESGSDPDGLNKLVGDFGLVDLVAAS